MAPNSLIEIQHCFLKHSLGCCNLSRLDSRILKKLILAVFASILVAFIEGWSFGVSYCIIFSSLEL